MMSDESDSENVELSAGLTEDAVTAEDRSRPDDTERLEIIRLMGQLGSGDQILWNDRKQPLTVVRRVSEDDLRGQCLNFRRLGRQWAAWAIKNGSTDMTEDEIKDFVGDVTPTGEFGKEFLLVRGPRGGLYRLSVEYSSRRGRHLPVFQNRVRKFGHAKGRHRQNDAWDGHGTEVLRLARTGHDGDADPDAVDTRDSASYVPIDNLAGRSVVEFPEGGPRKQYTFTESDVEAGVVPSAVSEYVRENYSTHSEEPDVGLYSASSGVTLDLSEYADAEPEDLPSRFSADTFLSITRGEDGGIHISEVPERVHHNAISADGAHIAETYDSNKSKTPRVAFGSSYPVFVENDGKEAVKNAPSASYDGDYQRWVVDGEDLHTALDALLDVGGVERITAPPAVLKYLTE